jgi:HPt (histidine-containing phosphotransfer) domain-containing protein
MQTYRHIDLKKMNQLFDGQINFKREILDEYSRLLINQKKRLREAWTESDFGTIRSVAHKIRPTCSYMGMLRAHNLATNYMKQYDADETSEAHELLDMANQLLKELDESLMELSAEQMKISMLLQDEPARRGARKLH